MKEEIQICLDGEGNGPPPPPPPSENLLNKAHDSADFNANPCFARLVVVVL